MVINCRNGHNHVFKYFLSTNFLAVINTRLYRPLTIHISEYQEGFVSQEIVFRLVLDMFTFFSTAANKTRMSYARPIPQG